MNVEAKLEALGFQVPDLESDYEKETSGVRFISHLAYNGVLYLSGTAPPPARTANPILPGWSART